MSSNGLYSLFRGSTGTGTNVTAFGSSGVTGTFFLFRGALGGGMVEVRRRETRTGILDGSFREVVGLDRVVPGVEGRPNCVVGRRLRTAVVGRVGGVLGLLSASCTTGVDGRERGSRRAVEGRGGLGESFPGRTAVEGRWRVPEVEDRGV
jgi:hypothetical protein